MKTIFTALCLSLLIFNTQIHAQGIVKEGPLKTVMKEMKKGLRVAVRATRAGDQSEEVIISLLSLKENIEKAGMILPPGISPTDEESVNRYQAMMGRLASQAQQLIDAFATSPLNKEQTMGILKEMNNLKKRGHAIFK
jgi:hypothetical protein